MGINDLTKFIKERVMDAYETHPLRNLSFTKMGVDTPILMNKFKHMNEAKLHEPHFNRYGWIWSFVYWISCLRKLDIHPIFIFEGKAPKEKEGTREARRKQRDQVKARTVKLEESLNSYLDTGVMDDLMVKEVAKLLKASQQDISSFEPHPLEYERDQVVDLMDTHIQKRQRYNMTITKKDYEILKLMFRIIGVPYVKAPGEAETLCAYLKNNGSIGSIYSSDTDVLVYGCNNVITDIDTKKLTYTTINVQRILECIGFDMDKFMDFCIMCGTDYNKNMAGIGPKRAFGLVQTYGSIEEVLKHKDKLDGSVLNHIAVRNIFKSYGSLGPWDEPLGWCQPTAIDGLIVLMNKLNINVDVEWLHTSLCTSSVEWDKDVRVGEEEAEWTF